MHTICSMYSVQWMFLISSIWIIIFSLQPSYGISKIPAAINLRLVDGPNPSEGRVEIQRADVSNSSVDNPWGTICNDRFEDDNRAATVICRELGYVWGESAGLQKYGQASDDLPLLLDEVICSGNETTILDCLHSGWGVHDCYHHEDVGVVCHNSTVRLQTHSKQPDVGAVQVLYRYKWADVCDDGWNDAAATLVCKELGFVHGVAECCSALGPNEASHVRVDHWDIDFSFRYTCRGREPQLTSCAYTSSSSHCDYSHRASVVCHNTTQDQVDMGFGVRLSEGDATWGRVEVRHSGIWGAVCNDKWDDGAANVTCKELGAGFIGGIALGPIRTVDMPFWLRDVACKGNETSLQECNYTQWGEPVFFCSAAYVLCYRTSGVQLDIVDGNLPSVGRVQITYDGVPGSICVEEWTPNDASMVCRMKGYGDGMIRTPSEPVNQPPFYFNRMICTTSRVNIFMCSSYGWQVNTDRCTESAHVTCYKDIRLVGGGDRAGIVEYMEGRRWAGLCNLGFKPEYAVKICQELGHANGSVLPAGAYGKYHNRLVRPNIKCTGNETSMMDCPYDEQLTCSSNYRYVAVCCHDNEPETGPRFQLLGTEPEPSFGRVAVRLHHVWGEICSDGWSDREAGVFCKTLGRGFKGGVAIYDEHRRGVPVLVSQISCKGNETDFGQCVVGKYLICQSGKQAGALCYKESAPRVTLVGGGRNYGRVQISMDDITGTVCKLSYLWNSDDASVICREISPAFTQGDYYSEFPAPTGEVLLRVERCTGLETSIFQCDSSGWKSSDPACQNKAFIGGVYCYGKVRIMDGKMAANVITGRVEILPPPDSGDGSDWITICGTGFDQSDAEVVCREMGYDNAKVLSPGSFGVKPTWKSYTNMECQPNGTDVHADCVYRKDGCKSSTHNYASVICHTSDIKKDLKYYIENGNYGRVIQEQYGVNGTICTEGWTDQDANVVCASAGFKGGVVFGTKETYERKMTIWATNVSCFGTEPSLDACPQSTNISMDCAMSIKTAGVLCFKQGIDVHLVNEENALHYGRVEIEYDGERGTVCDYEWSTYDARVLCRQLGFPDGEAYRKAYYGQGNGTVMLSAITCDNTESSLLACPHLGWKGVHYKCSGHETDAGVRCKRSVMMDQAANYGAVKVWDKDSYKLVCADGFGDLDAMVVCKNLGYQYGKSLCCSAFGDQRATIGFSRSRCTGREVRYSDCRKVVGAGGCLSKQYASVVCSRERPSNSFDVSIKEYEAGMGSGPVLIDYFNQKGYMCAEGFDDADAQVLCRQKGYHGGYAYKFYNEGVKQRATTDLRWFQGPNCTGNEHKLEMCEGAGTPNVSGCFVLSHAAVNCYMDQADAEFDIRLRNAPHPGEGYVQVRVNGTWGSICTHSNLISNFEATVVCRQLNFKYGVAIPIPNYPPLNGTVWLSNMNCVGTESNVRECLLSGMGSTISPFCKTHSFDMAVKCYANVRISGSQTPNYGMVQVLNETANRWVAVCDEGFDDVDAGVVCRNIGYKDGKAQCCSSLGPKLSFYNPIEVADVQCEADEKDFMNCQYTMSPDVTCPTGNFAIAVCTDTSPPLEDLKVSITDGRYFGNVEVTRYGITGSVCDVGWDDRDADVLCRELGFVSGKATNGTSQSTKPILLTSVNCTGSEKTISECQYPDMNTGHECNERLTRAAVFCSMTTDKVEYRVADLKNGRGRAEVLINGRWGTICDLFWDDTDADMFCRQVGHLGGESTVLVTRGSSAMPIWMSHVECTGKETDFLQCRMSWDSLTTPRCSHYDDAGVKCFSSARLNRGDYRSGRTNGIVEMYLPPTDSYTNSWFTVCADTFTDKEAEVVCRVLGHERGMAVCCSPYGYNTSPMATVRPRCNGTENQLTECEMVRNDTRCDRQEYAAVTCYTGNRSQTEYSVGLKGSLKYTGQVVLKYLGVPGRICWTGWDDRDARVACRELGFRNGSAYYHYKSSFIYLDYNGPYWTSDLNCTGEESQLSDCPHIGFGNVTTCHDRGHYAGVVCFDETDVAYRIAGGDARYGRVEFTYDGTWHTICSNTWGSEEANVTCKQLGFVTGDKYSGKYNEPAMGKAYSINFRCKGDEYNLNDCPHEGLQEAMYCQDHKEDEGVFCYTSVKLSGPQGMNSGNGSVLYYLNDTWARVCDEGFDDITARRVCRELGFADGRSLCCSAFGDFSIFDEGLSNYSLNCSRDDQSIESCLVHTECQTDTYASAICFKQGEVIDEETYSFALEKSPDRGQVVVTHMGVKGRICSRDWDDRDATVLCRSKGYAKGVAYQHSESNVLREKRGPYWLGGFNCTGDESDLLQCPRLNRTNLDNCTFYDIASVLCYNESGIEYRLMGGSDHYGRVEVKVGSEWGTVCDQYWDKREAAVFCRQMNFTDGEAIGRAHFGRGTGPIWISHLECTGRESVLHQCPHRGFANEYSFDWWFPLPCETHSDDAGVFCYKSVRFNTGPNVNAGGLEIHKDGKWYGICDSGFTKREALVACKSIRKDFIDVTLIPGSAYGNLSGEIGFTHVTCNGTENDLTDCSMKFNSTCNSGFYVSAFCSNKTIIDNGVQFRVATDSLSSTVHGIIEAQVNGIWGRVCLHNFDDVDASVACRHFGFDGGVAYLHIMKNDRPVLVRDVRCNGTEQSLEECQYEKMTPDLKHCHYGSNDAGVICYYKTDGMGFTYRLNGGSDPSNGRVEIGYGGRWGMVCAWSWQTADASVLCRALGYKDGIVNYTKNESLKFSVPWVTGFFCQGDESTPMTCLNTGFNSTFLTDLCMGGRDPGAYSQCFKEKIEPVKVRLADGPDEYSGRVEVYVAGADQWGSICDDYWDEDDATVVCRQLGLYGGTALRKAPFGPGSGPIWYDNMKCFGNETTLFNCSHRGLGTHNCNHTEDVGVICDPNPPVVPTTLTTTSTLTTRLPVTTTTHKPTTSTPRPTTTRKTTTTAKPTTTTTTKKTTVKPTTEKTTTEQTSAKTPQTKPPTTIKPTTVVPTTTKKTTTHQQSTKTDSTTESVQTTIIVNATMAPQVNSSSSNVGVIVAVPLFVILIILVIGVVVFLKCRRTQWPSYSREHLEDTVISREPDGTVTASNQLYDLHLPPTSQSGDVISGNEGDNMKFGSNGSAHYSKGITNGGSNTSAFTNPLYEANKDLETIGQNGIHASLPGNGEISSSDIGFFEGQTDA